MFEPIDRSTVETAASAMNEELLHELFDPFVSERVLSTSECTGICEEIVSFLRLIKDESCQGEEFWTRFQQHFGFAKIQNGVVPMNAANLCPEPISLLHASNLLRLSYNNNVAQQMRMADGPRVQQIERTRCLLAQGVGLADPNDIALVRNASEANNAVNCGFRDWNLTSNPNERDNVVLWSENHPTNLASWELRRNWHNMEKRSGGQDNSPLFDINMVTLEDTDTEEADITAKFTSQIGPRTRFVAYSAISNGNGFRMPKNVIKGIWDHVQQNNYDCHIHIDGTMAWGASQVNLAQPYCHSFVSSAHKWFLGPKEIGLLFMSKDKVKKFAPSIYAYDYKIEIHPWDKIPETALRFELLGQRDDANIITLAATQMMWTALGIREPHTRVSELSQYLVDLLDRSPIDWQLVTPHRADRRWGVIRVKAPKGTRAKNLYNWLYEDSEYRIAGSGNDETFRLCPHIYNTKVDIERAVKGMDEWHRMQ